MAAAAGVQQVRGNNFVFLNLLDFKLFTVPEMLEHLPIFIGYRDFFHTNDLQLYFWLQGRSDQNLSAAFCRNLF